jgi:glycosyltransferase involved in cell wall biosynthesis
LDALFVQDFPDREIIVINDGSTDGTHEYLTALAAERRIVYIHQQNMGPARARNAGIAAAKGDYTAMIDDDCVAPPNWLSLYHKQFQNSAFAGCGGVSKTGDPENPYAVVNDLIANVLKTEINSSTASNLPFLTSNNAVYKTAALRSVGAFDESFFIGAEERDLNFRLVKSGARLGYALNIVVEHFNDARLGAFTRHQFHQGIGSRIMYANAAHSAGIRPPMIPFVVYLRLFFSPFRYFKIAPAIHYFFLIVLAQTAITAGYFLGNTQSYRT